MSVLPRDASAAPIPSGTVTFVFTDIEGSTQRWDRDREAMEEAVRRHDALMRAAIAAHSGHVFKTIGDAFCAAFSRPEDAVAAMLDAQRSLAAQDFTSIDGLRVRAAIHTGTADERDADYFGPTVNRVARLLGVAHGGQVLVSGVARDLAQGGLPPQASLRDLGEHRLKDLSRPEYVYQLLAPGLPADFPPLRSLDAHPNNLPLQLTSFVGREAEIAEIAMLLETNRLVTLVGSGGIGKTRTSLQVAANQLGGAGDGVWFVEIAPLSNGAFIATTIAQIVGLSLPADGEPLVHLVRAMRVKRALLVFDNCEHLIDAVAQTIAAILRDCPKVTILASSRQGLGMAGEATFRLPCLEVPSAKGDASLSAVDALRSAAIALFVERARAADHRFELTDANATIVADICRRLDGIALAIELAASRVKVLSPKQLHDRLDERFRVLTGGSRDLLPRQQTLRALIDWSHDLLAEEERTLFRRLGIFVNGFTLEAASAVTSDDALDEFAVFDGLASLVEKSLVLAESHDDSVRYRLLESTRAYAGEKLVDAGEREALASRHLRYLRDAFRTLRAAVMSSLRGEELRRAFEVELDDVRAALDGALARSDFGAGAELLAEIGSDWADRGISTEGRARLEAFLGRVDRGNARLVAWLYIALCTLLNTDNRRTREHECSLEAVAYARRSGDDETLGAALFRYAGVCIVTNRLDEAEVALAEVEGKANHSMWLSCKLIDSRAALSLFTGDFEAAVRAMERLIENFRAAQYLNGVHTSLLNLSEIHHARGETKRAIATVRDALPGLRQTTNRLRLSTACNDLAAYLLAVDDPDAAVDAARESIGVLASSEPDHVHVAIAIEHLALAWASRDALARAAILQGYADACFTRAGFEREPTERQSHDRLLALLGAGFSTGDRARYAAEGAALTPEAAIALALQELREPSS